VHGQMSGGGIGTGHALVFEDMALVEGATPVTTKFDEVDFDGDLESSRGTNTERGTPMTEASYEFGKEMQEEERERDRREREAERLDEDEIAETPRMGAGMGTGFMLFSGGSASTRGLQPEPDPERGYAV